ncbi:MAG: hypothetical protein KF770_24600 [Anaerolineae bacterium]|nr:hypothetical protein [Anaerolineae bacterium]
MAEYQESEVSRRGFLLGMGVTAVAATTVGAGAALLKGSQQAAVTTITTLPPAAPVVSLPPLAANAGAESFTQLATAQAEIIRLQAALDAANRQIEALSQPDSGAIAAQETLRTELASANERVSVLAGLVALYEQLDGVDLGAALDNGLTAVSGALTNLLDDIPSLEASMAAGTLALAEVENHLPVLANGRAWLDAHLNKLDGYFHQIEKLLMDVVERAGAFVQMVNEWFAGVKKWLPFGIGEKATTIMQSITTLLLETPATITGLNANLAQPLDVWLARDEQNEIALNKKLVKPLRDDLMVKTTVALSKAKGVESVYAVNLQEPVGTAVARQQTLRTLIADYRQQHQV